MKYLGVDFGLKRIGLAVSEGTLASSWKVINTNSFKDSIDQLERIIKTENFDKVIVGKPDGGIGKLVEKLAKVLSSKGIMVEFADETLSSKNATSLMVDLNIPKKKREVNDSFAASQILQNFLDDCI